MREELLPPIRKCQVTWTIALECYLPVYIIGLQMHGQKERDSKAIPMYKHWVSESNLRYQELGLEEMDLSYPCPLFTKSECYGSANSSGGASDNANRPLCTSILPSTIERTTI